jgi:hypothetical protein
MTLQIPHDARFTMRGALADRLTRFWPMRNADDHPTRIVARSSIHQIVEVLRQLIP